MPAPKNDRLYGRISSETARQIADLARIWGPVKALSQAEVAAEAIRRAWEAEMAKEKQE